MKLFVRGAAVLVLGLLAGTAQAQPSIGVGGGDCGSPQLSKSIGKAFVMRPGKPCLSFVNDVGRLAELTIDTSVGFAKLRVQPESELKTIELSRGARRVRVFGGVVAAGEIAIRIQPLEAPVTITLRGFRRAPGAHVLVPPAAPPPAAQGEGEAKARRTSE